MSEVERERSKLRAALTHVRQIIEDMDPTDLHGHDQLQQEALRVIGAVLGR